MAAVNASPDDGPRAETRRTSVAAVQCSSSPILVKNKQNFLSGNSLRNGSSSASFSSPVHLNAQSRALLTSSSSSGENTLEHPYTRKPPSFRIPKKSPKEVKHHAVSQNDIFLTAAIHFAAGFLGIYEGKGEKASQFWATYFPRSLRVPKERSDYAYKKIVDQQLKSSERAAVRLEAFTWLARNPQIVRKIPDPVGKNIHEFIIFNANFEVSTAKPAEEIASTRWPTQPTQLSLTLSQYRDALHSRQEKQHPSDSGRVNAYPAIEPSGSPAISEIFSESSVSNRTMVLFDHSDESLSQESNMNNGAEMHENMEDEIVTGENSFGDSDTDDFLANLDSDEILMNAGLLAADRVKQSKFAPKGALVRPVNSTGPALKNTKEQMQKLFMTMERVHGRRTEIDNIIQLNEAGADVAIPPMWKLDSKIVRMADIPGVLALEEAERNELLKNLEADLEAHRTSAQVNTLFTLMDAMDKIILKIQEQLTALEKELPEEGRDRMIEEIHNEATTLVKKDPKPSKPPVRGDSDGSSSSSGYPSSRQGNNKPPFKRNFGGPKRGGFSGRGKPRFHPY